MSIDLDIKIRSIVSYYSIFNNKNRIQRSINKGNLYSCTDDFSIAFAQISSRQIDPRKH